MSAPSAANKLTYVFMYSRDLNHGRLRLIIVVIFARSFGGDISMFMFISKLAAVAKLPPYANQPV